MMIQETFHLTSKDGLKLLAKKWLPENEPKAVIALVHGLGEHLGRYERVANFYNQAQIGIFALDLRGHGKSEGPRGHTPSLEAFLSDIEILILSIREEFIDIPIVLYGHSMGGNLATNYLLSYPGDEIRAAIITSPWYKLGTTPPKLQVRLAKVMNRIYPAFTNSFTKGMDISVISRDPEVCQAYIDDPLVHDRISAGLFLTCYQSGLDAIARADQLRIPTLLMHGTDDLLTSFKGSQEFAARAGEKITFKLWSDFKHETHNELEWKEVLEFQLDWLKNQL